MVKILRWTSIDSTKRLRRDLLRDARLVSLELALTRETSAATRPSLVLQYIAYSDHYNLAMTGLLLTAEERPGCSALLLPLSWCGGMKVSRGSYRTHEHSRLQSSGSPRVMAQVTKTRLSMWG